MATDNTATYSVQLDDGVSGPAGKAASALDDLRGTMAADTAALAAMNKAMRNLKGDSAANVAQIKTLRDQIAAKRVALAKAQSQYLELGGALDGTARKSRSFRDRMSQVTAQAQAMPGPLGQLVGLFDRFAKLVGGGAMAAGIVAVAAGIGLLVAATVKATTSLYQYGVAQAAARRSEALRLEGLSRLRNALTMYHGIQKMTGGELQQGIDRVSSASALGRDQIARYGEQLYRAGLRGKQWQQALEGVAVTASAAGEQQAGVFARWAAGAALTGRSVEALANRAKARYGDIAKAQLLDADVQARKLSENMSSLFNGIKLEGLLKAKAELFSLFDQSTESGRALRALLERIMQPLVDAVAAALPHVKAFFQDILIWELGIEIAFLRVRNAFRKAFNKGDWTDLKGLAGEALEPLNAALIAVAVTALWTAAPAIAGVGAAALGAAGSVLAFIGSVAVVATPFVLAAAAVWGVISLVKQLWDLFDEISTGISWSALWDQLVDDWKAVNWGDLGKWAVKGLLAGLESIPVVGSVVRMGKGILSTVTDMFGIASPSRVFMRLGTTLPQGFAAGIDRGRPDVERSVGGLVDLPAAPAVAPGGGAGARGRGASVTVGDIHIHASGDGGGGDARQLAQDFKRELESILEGVALQMGAA